MPISNSAVPAPLPRNLLLRALAPADLNRLLPRLTPVEMPLTLRVVVPDRPVDALHFMESGTVSMISELEDGSRIEVGMVGNEGFVGMPLLLGADTSALEGLVQVEGEALRLPADRLQAALADTPGLLPLLLRYVESFHLQVAQTAACNGRHAIEQRLARWLLMTHDRVEGDSFTMTQEFLSIMLGVRRPGVTVAIGALQRAGFVEHRRRTMRVLDRAGLEAACCECYAMAKRRFAWLDNVSASQFGAARRPFETGPRQRGIIPNVTGSKRPGAETHMEPRPPDGHTSDARAILKNCRMDLDAVRREAGWQADTACPPPTAEAVLGSVVDRLDRLTALIEGTFAGPGQLSLTQAEMVAREADHRIRNNLQLVASLLQRQAREANDVAANALRLAAAQVGAVAALHSFLHDGARQIAHDGGRIDLSGYLEGLAQSFADTFELGDAQRSLHVELETVMVTPDTARSIGLIVSELVANALRHAFTSAEPGTIRITGKLRRADGAYQLAIQDDGAGLPQGFDLRLRQTGFGLRLVSLLADQLRARLTVHGKPGARFLLTLPPVQ